MLGESMLITRAVQRRPARWVTFAASLVIHSFFLAALIITPLIDADAGMPSLTIETIFLSAPPPPVLPPPPSGGSGQKGTIRRQSETTRANEPPQTPDPGQLKIPLDIPERIPEENLTFSGGPLDGSPTVEGAATGWNEGEDIPGLKKILGDSENGPSLGTVVHSFEMRAPKLLRRIAPDYPPLALKARIQGTVLIEAQTDVYGKVTRTQVKSGHPLLVKAAMEAVQQWLYEPAIINGIPRPVNFFVEVIFTLTK
jgi:protein TonB